MNIMVMAGTKDAANIIEKLSSTEKFNILATTTTSYGADIAKAAGADEIISKGLTLEELVEVIKTNDINILIDATHPFAAIATYNAIKSSKITGIKYLRFERPLEDLKENDLIYEAPSFEEAALKAEKLTKGRVLHLAGVSTLKPVVEKIDSSRLFARVLPSVNSIQKCIDLGIKQENIIAMQGVFSKKFNKVLFEEYNISLIITKESGETGGTLSKISAAVELGLDVVLVTRPKVAELENNDIFIDLDEIVDFMLKIT
jgi:precorrin-6A/cobalt-precorrin-6A reductase